MSSYATPTDLTTFGINANALAGFTTQQQQDALDARAAMIDSAISTKFTLPLIPPFPADIRMYCAITAAFDLMTSRGFDPSDDSNRMILARYEDMSDWLKGVAAGRLTPVVKDSSNLAGAGNNGGGGPFVQQAVVVGGSVVPSGLSIQGAAPASVTQLDGGGQLVVGQPRLRGWNRG